MGLERTLTLPNKENMGFYLASGAYLLTGLVDGLLTMKCLNLGNMGNITDWWPLTQFFVDHYGIESGITLAKANSLIAVAIGGVIERRAISNSQKNLMRNAFYAGTALSELGIMAGITSLYFFLR